MACEANCCVAKPLRELSLSVQVNSALPLKSVTCPTHSVRTEQTQHSAQLDFAAQEYTPDRDFEVVCEDRESQVRRRGRFRTAAATTAISSCN